MIGRDVIDHNYDFFAFFQQSFVHNQYQFKLNVTKLSKNWQDLSHWIFTYIKYDHLQCNRRWNEILYLILKLQDDGFAGNDWTNIIIPGDMDRSDFHHEKSFLLTDLVADAEYECLVQAKNIYGWSEASRIHRFFTHSTTFGKQVYFIKDEK